MNFFAQASDGIRVGQWDLQMDKMKEIPFIVPPADEQVAIVEYIKKTLFQGLYVETREALRGHIKVNTLTKSEPFVFRGGDRLTYYDD